ncbi:MAG: T9SS type A sorting domain-containing protein [Bacteriodetes bacterium]|nr:T9SS type A sorting domain-containing protein [Bacteroidota bacterium]
MNILTKLFVVSIFITLSTYAYAQWQQCNGPYGGWITALAKNGNTVYAGMDEDGLYRSIDSGNTWKYIGLKGNSIKLVYSLDSVIITGNSSSLYRSSDLGKSWQKLQVAQKYNGASQLLGFGSIIYASVNGYIYKSKDAGLTWNSINVDRRSLTYLTLIDSTIFSCQDSILYRLSNDETIWIELGLKQYAINSVAKHNNNLIAITYNSDVYKSSDNGTTWNKISTIPTPWPVRKSLVAIDTILVASTTGNTRTGVYRSSDGGYTWIKSNNGLSCYNAYCHVQVANSLYIGTSGGGVFRSDNKGLNWTHCSVGLKPIGISCFTASNNILFAGTGVAGIFRSSNSGETWGTVSNGLNDENIWSLISNKSTIIAGGYGGYYGGIYSSENLGDSWDTLGLTRHTIMSIANKGDTIFAGTDSQKGIYRSLNGGRTWEKVYDMLYDCYSLFIDDSVVYAGKGGTVNSTIKSTDWGLTWDIVDFGTQTGYMKSFAKLDSLIFFANIEVFRSSDKGISWKKMLFVNYSINDIVTYNKAVYLGTENGIYQSTDLGDTWKSMNDGLRDRNIRVLSIVGNTLYAGTQDSGLYKYNLLSTNITEQPSISGTHVRCYPNPANDELTISLTTTTELQQPLQYSITNILGTSVLQWQQMERECTIPIHTLPSGVYYVTVKNNRISTACMVQVIR